ncbi:MAG: hypothetical protein J6K42_03075 [Clostridia bacterium]|nr:hypothetical protein [Clostridia bacterium]
MRFRGRRIGDGESGAEIFENENLRPRFSVPEAKKVNITFTLKIIYAILINIKFGKLCLL